MGCSRPLWGNLESCRKAKWCPVANPTKHLSSLAFLQCGFASYPSFYPPRCGLLYKAGSNKNFWKVPMMVEQILELLRRTLNGFLGSKGLGPDPVVISNIMDHDGRVVPVSYTHLTLPTKRIV